MSPVEEVCLVLVGNRVFGPCNQIRWINYQYWNSVLGTQSKEQRIRYMKVIIEHIIEIDTLNWVLHVRTKIICLS